MARGSDFAKFDVGLAAENMSIMAQSLGYGTKIIAAPINVINGDRKTEYQEKLGIPEDPE